MMNKRLSSYFIFCFCFIFLVSCQQVKTSTNDASILKIFSPGEYIDPDLLTEFEKEYNIKVIYDTFDSNESMYQKIKSGSVHYDVLVPSDYMIEKLIAEDFLYPLDFEKIPNIKDIKPELLYTDFDKEQRYSVPYFWGTVGILYDTRKVQEPVDSWSILWNKQYQDNIIMYNSQRDSIMVALKKLGYSMNTKNENELTAAKNALIEQKPLVFGYLGDEVINSMMNNQAALSVVYSGDAVYIMSENPNLKYALPKEGTNVWIDAMVVTKQSQNKDIAQAFINFMSSQTNAEKNTLAVGYSTPNRFTFEKMIQDPENAWMLDISYNPNLKNENNEFFHNPGKTAETYSDIWEEVLNT